MSWQTQVYTLFTVLKCNLVFVFRCFLHYHFHATCFGNSLPSSVLADCLEKVWQILKRTPKVSLFSVTPVYYYCLENVGALISHNPMGLHRLLQV
jgi:hypothetical protein